MKQLGTVSIISATNTRPNWVGALKVIVVDGRIKPRDYIRSSPGKLYRITQLQALDGSRIAEIGKGSKAVLIVEPDLPPPIVNVTSMLLKYPHEFVEDQTAQILGDS
jgi:hypothetical protein